MPITTQIIIEDTAVNTTYQDVTGTTAGGGTGAKFDVVKTDGKYAVTLDTATASSGSGYVAGDTITIPGTSLGGLAPDHNLIVTVGTVGSGGKIATFGAVGSGRVGDGEIDLIIKTTGTSSNHDVFSLDADLDDLIITINDGVVSISHSDLDNVVLSMTDIERLVGNNKEGKAFDVDGRAGEVYTLLAAALGQNDITPALMGRYLFMSDLGMSDTQIANSILASKEYAEDALGTSNETFVKQVWVNVSGSLPSLEQLQIFTKVLDDKVFTKAELLEAASNLDLFRDQNHLNMDAITLTGIDYIAPLG